MGDFQVGDKVRLEGVITLIHDRGTFAEVDAGYGRFEAFLVDMTLVERPRKAKPLHLVVEPNLPAATEAFRRASALAAGAPTRQNSTRLSVEYPDHEVWWVGDGVALPALEGLTIQSWSTDWAAFRGGAPSEGLQALLNRNLAKSKRVAW